MKQAKKRHALLVIRCPNVLNTDMKSKEENGRFICEHCLDDFTEELRDIYKVTIDRFAN